MFAAGPPLFALTPQHTYDGPSLHAVDGTMLLRPGRNGEAVAGCYPRVKANVTSGTATVPPDRVVAGLARLTEVAPGLGSLRAGRVWSGVEGYLPDMLPVIGPSATTPGVLHAFGFSGHGYQLSPGVGAVIADLLADGATETPIEPFSVRRFAQGVIADDKLSSEFDPAAIGNVRQASGASGNA
jgi:sarcosine oxidase subunit beta